jgi:hypothetical protein
MADEETQAVEAPQDAAPPAEETQPDPYDYGSPDEVELEAPSSDENAEPAAPDGGEDEPEASEIDSELMARAEEAGLSQEYDQAVFGSPETLQATLEAIDRALKAQEPVSEASPPREPEPEPAPKVEARPSELKLDLDPEVYDESIINAFKTLQQHHEGEVASLRQDLETVAAHIVHQQEVAESNQLDTFIDKLGDDWQAVYGKGPASKLPPRSRAAQNRAELKEHVKLLGDTLGLSGDDLLQYAHRGLHGDTETKRARQDFSRRLRDTSGRFTARPTQRQKPTDNGEQELIRRTAQRMKDIGWGDTYDTGDTNVGL